MQKVVRQLLCWFPLACAMLRTQTRSLGKRAHEEVTRVEPRPSLLSATTSHLGTACRLLTLSTTITILRSKSQWSLWTYVLRMGHNAQAPFLCLLKRGYEMENDPHSQCPQDAVGERTK